MHNFLHTYYPRLVMAGACLCLTAVLPAADKGDLLHSILAPVEMVPVRETIEVSPPVVEEEVVEPVKPEMITLGIEPVLVRVEEEVSRQLRNNSRVSLDCRTSWKPVTIEKDKEWDVVLHNDFMPDTRGRWYASVSVEVEGEIVVTRQLRMEAALFEEVWMAQQRLMRGDAPGDSAVQPVMRNIYLERGNLIPASEDLSGFELVHSVGEGNLLAWDDLRQRPSVRKGNIVEVIVKQGALTVTMRARSLEDGLMGDDILVKNLNSHREVIGTVIGPDQIQFYP